MSLKKDSLTNSGPVVKHYNRSRRPPYPGLEVVASHHMLQHEVEDQFRFSLLQARNSSNEFAVYEYALLTSNWMNPHERMESINRIFPHQSTQGSSMSYHFGGRVSCLEPVQQRAKSR